MKNYLLPLFACLILLFFHDSCTTTSSIKKAKGKISHAIAEMEYLTINNWRQFLLIRGADTVTNPVILFLHGGPGASGTALMRKYNHTLETDFTVVYWDQRGAGKSYNKKIDPSTLTVKQLIDDANKLTDYLRKRFKQKKIFLIGHSWGSRLGMYLVKAYPEKFNAYIGVGQEISSYEGELQSYQFTLNRAKSTNNTKAINDLLEMGLPKNDNYTSMYKTGFWGLVKQKEWLLKLGGERYKKKSYSDWIFQMLWSDEYSIVDLINWSRASAFTAGQMMKDPDFNQFDLRRDIPSVKVPVYFISGLYDYNCPWPLVKEYYQKLSSTKKDFFLFEKSGHSPLFEESTKFNSMVMKLFKTTRISD